MRFIFISFLFLFFTRTALALPDPVDSTLNTGKFLRDKVILPVPVVFRFPETGFGAGAILNATFSFARDARPTDKPSQLSFGVTFTQRKQVLVFLPFSIFYRNNRYYFTGDNGWYRYNYFYFGVGEERVASEIYDVTYPRIRLLATKLISRNTYAGFRYQYESYNITRTDPEGELSSGRIAGSSFSRTSSLGVSVLRDTRDLIFYPHKGVFGEFYVLPTLRAFGADRNFTRILLDVAHYKSLRENVVLATNYVGITNLGRDVPFNQLSLLGGPNRMRGLLNGFFRDRNTLLTQAETRWEINRYLGLVGFGSVGFMGNEADILRLDKPKYTYGLGMRLTAQQKNHLNIRLDYGMSPYGTGNFYITVGEAF